MQLQQTLTEIFQDVFDDDSLSLRPELTAADVPGWDSLNHIRLLVTIERKLNVKFSVTEVADLKTVGDLMKVIESKTATAPSKS